MEDAAHIEQLRRQVNELSSAQQKALELQRKTERQLVLLVEASRVLIASPDPHSAVRTVLELAARFITADAYAVWRRQDSDGTWARIASQGLSRNYERISHPHTVTGQVPEGPIAIDDLDSDSFVAARRELYRAEGLRSMLVIPLVIRGERTGTLVFYYRSPHHFSESEQTVAMALGNLGAATLSAAELYSQQISARALAEAAERRAEFLADAGALLSSSLDYEHALQCVADLAVPAFADWCCIDIRNETGEIERLALQHVDPARIQFALELAKTYPARADDTRSVALRTGKSLLFSDISESAIVAWAHDAEHARLIRNLGLKSYIIAPLVARGRILGAFTFITAESGRRYSEADLQLAQELARRAAVAIENARLHRDVRASEERLRLAMEAGKIGAWDWDIVRDHIEWSDRVYELHGVEPGSFGAKLEDFTRVIHPGDLERVTDEIRKAIYERRPYEVEFRVVHPNGDVHWLATSAQVIFGEQNQPVRMLGATMETTERRHAEEKLRASEGRLRRFMESDIIGIIVSTESGVITEANDRFLAMVGYSREELYSGQIRWTDMTPPEFLPLDHAAIAECHVRGACTPYEKEYIRKDGSRIPILMGYALLEGSSTDFICFVLDLTDRKRVEQAVVNQAQALARSNADLKQFAFAASHDLQEPLRMVNSYSRLLATRFKGKLDAQADEFLAFIDEGTRRMANLIHDLLSYSQVLHQEPERTQVDCNKVVADAVANCRAAIEEKGALVTCDPLPAVTGDEGQLLQVFQNLISNAIKYSKPEEPPRIHIDVADSNDQWVFSVRDNGIGIPEQFLEKVFVAFKRLHGRDRPGTGVGLAICERIIKRCGGRIWVESAVGAGSRFFFSIPKSD